MFNVLCMHYSDEQAARSRAASDNTGERAAEHKAKVTDELVEEEQYVYSTTLFKTQQLTICRKKQTKLHQ
jgi:hypothetical protein